MGEHLLTFIIFITIGILGILHIHSLRDKFILETESQNILSNLSLLSLTPNETICLQNDNNKVNIFYKNSSQSLKKFNINNKISVSSTTSQICCQALTCTPSTIELKLNSAICQIIISIRGQIRKVCKKG